MNNAPILLVEDNKEGELLIMRAQQKISVAIP